jgi:hypothetical protein
MTVRRSTDQRAGYLTSDHNTPSATESHIQIRSFLVPPIPIVVIFVIFHSQMDLTAAIRLKIDRLRSAKTARYNALSTSIERELALLTRQSADLFTKLEDALESNVLGTSTDAEELKKFKEEEGDKDGMVEEDADLTEESSIREKNFENTHEVYDIEEEKEGYYDQESDLPATTSVTHETVIIPPGKPSDTLVSDLRSRAQETQSLLAEKHAFLTHLRQKHDLAMKRLDKLQADLEKVSQKWEAEERARIQAESTTALGKRKREDQDDDSNIGENSARKKAWKTWGIKGVEWGVLFGIGVASAVGMSKFQH